MCRCVSLPDNQPWIKIKYPNYPPTARLWGMEDSGREEGGRGWGGWEMSISLFGFYLQSVIAVLFFLSFLIPGWNVKRIQHPPPSKQIYFSSMSKTSEESMQTLSRSVLAVNFVACYFYHIRKIAFPHFLIQPWSRDLPCSAPKAGDCPLCLRLPCLPLLVSFLF